MWKKQYLSTIGTVGIRIWTGKTILLASEVKLLTLNTECITVRWEHMWSPNTLNRAQCTGLEIIYFRLLISTCNLKQNK